MEEKKYILSKDTLGERPGVMWAWVDKLDDEEIIHQIKAFKAGGVNEFYIHPCWTWEGDPYISEGFMKQIKLAADTAESLGMHYSIYDECGWASGTCGGQLMEKYPAYRMTQLTWVTTNVMAGGPMELWFTGKVLAVQVMYSDKLARREDITDQVRIEVFGDNEGGRVFWQNNNCASAKVWVFCKQYNDFFSATNYWRPDAAFKPGFVDTMNPAAIRKFFEMNHEPYRKILGNKFGTFIQHIFTDETSMSGFCDPSTRPYSAVLEDEFFKDHGYHLRDHYIALTGLFDTDEDIKVRYDFHKTCTRQFCESYLDQYVAWCRENNLLLTGHMSGEGVLQYQSCQFGDFYEALSRFDIPGVDNILSKHYVDLDEWAWETKMLASVAKFAGKKRTMCETFSGSGWDLTLEDAKRIMNKLMTLGVTYTIYMTASSSLNEGRKNFPIGYPPSHGFQNPLFAHYSTLSDYNALRSSLMTQTMHLGHALVLVPQIDGWVNLERSRGDSKLNQTWMQCTLALQKRSVEHDMLFESIISDVEVSGGKINLRGYTYDTLIVPCITCSNQCTLDKIAAFAAQGGRLVFVDRFPTIAADTGKKYNFGDICGLSDTGKAFFDTDTGVYGVLEEGNVQLVRWGEMINVPKERFRDTLSAFVKAGSAEDAIEPAELPAGVTLSRRNAEGLDCVLVCNDTNETHTVRLRINSEKSVSVLDGITLADAVPEDGILTLTVAPHDMPIVLLTAEGVCIDCPEKAAVKKPVSGERRTMQLDHGWRFATARHNMLPIKMKYLANKEPNGVLDEDLLKQAETAVVQYATSEFPTGQGLTFGSGYAAFGRFEIEEMPSYLELFNEVVGDGEIWLNGKRVTGFHRVHEFGPKDSVAEVTALAKIGVNTVVVISRVPAWRGPHCMPSIIMRGSFRLSGSKMIAISDEIEPRTYTAQGWRYYSGESTFSTTFTLDCPNPKAVSIAVDTKEIVEILVNGVSAGTRCWKPYEADITALCRQGENTLELKFTTTMEATMVIEEVELVSQGFSAYKDEASIKDAGLLSAPLLTVTMW